MPPGLSTSSSPSAAVTSVLALWRGRRLLRPEHAGHLFDRLLEGALRRESRRQLVAAAAERLRHRGDVVAAARTHRRLEPPVALLLEHRGDVGLARRAHHVDE